MGYPERGEISYLANQCETPLYQLPHELFDTIDVFRVFIMSEQVGMPELVGILDADR
jgi:hypothetical protein